MVQRTGKSQVTFVFKPQEGACEKVAIAGSFNDWQPSLGKMVKQKDGSYRKRLELTPGEHRYKFYVDGQWIADAESEFYVPNPFGTLDSLVVVK
jgi:1,4-alpha-glucan branching enzyme